MPISGIRSVSDVAPATGCPSLNHCSVAGGTAITVTLSAAASPTLTTRPCGCRVNTGANWRCATTIGSEVATPTALRAMHVYVPACARR